MRVPPEEFEALVEHALANLPDEFKAALVERARAGVRVCLMYDSLGSLGLPVAFLDELRAAGVLLVAIQQLAR